MIFWHDKERDLLIYESMNPLASAGLSGAQVAGKYWAVPRTLANCQILRFYGYPVPPIVDDSNYDWPIERGRKPLAHQKVMANFLALHRRCFNLSDMGCVAGETLLETDKGPRRIDALARQGQKISVRALVDGAVRLVPAECPFAKGFARIYRVIFRSGRTVDVTAKHFFLTSRGWVSCADLAVGEQLPRFDGGPRVSTSEFYLSKLLRDARHSTQTIPNSQGRFDSPSCGEQLLSDEGSGPVLFPSPADAQGHTPPLSQTDARGTKRTRMDLLGACLHSTLHYIFPSDPDWARALVYVSTTKRGGSRFCTSVQYRPFSTPAQAALSGRESPSGFARYPAGMEVFQRECAHKLLGPSQLTAEQFEEHSSLHEAKLGPPLWKTGEESFDTVTHITYLKTDVYYDLHVPVHENYIAHGLCHHNTMKTLAALWAADWLMKQQPEGTCRALIVAPLSTLERVWGNAIFSNFLSRRSFEILHGAANKRVDLLGKKADFSIVNFDGLVVGAHTHKRLELDGFCKQLAERDDIRICIVDEASAYKDAQTKRHRVSRLVIGKREHLWLLTGTPTPNAPTDAYGLAKLVNNAWGKSFAGFQSETMMKISQFKWVPQRDGYDKARRLLQPSIRYDLRDIWDGPEMATQQREVPLTEQQKKLMVELKRDFQLQIKSGQPITAANEAAARQKFIQISLGAVYDRDHKAQAVDAKPRLQELREVLRQATGKALIFVPLTSVVNLLYSELKNEWSCEIVNGHVSAKERNRIFGAFQESADSEPRLLIADPGTMAHGLDLWQARTVIWYGPTDKTELYLQANRRAHRPGQKYPVTVVQIVSNKLEREIYRRLETNTSLQGALLEMVRREEL